jgi:hypothetical protein
VSAPARGTLVALLSVANLNNTTFTGVAMRHRALVCVLASAGLAACGSSTAPGGISVGGHWNVTVSDLSGSGHVCNGTLTANFTQSFNTFDGTYSGNTMTCVTNGTSQSIGQVNGTVTDGKVDGQSVTFSLDNTPDTFTGTVNVSHISGALTWTADFGDGNGPVTLNGSWVATKA